jgi:hypothetical protein
MEDSALRALETGDSAGLDAGDAVALDAAGSLALASTGMDGLGRAWLPDRRNRSCVAVASFARAPAKLGKLSRDAAPSASTGGNGPS